jgi:hypothetical protein
MKKLILLSAFVFATIMLQAQTDLSLNVSYFGENVIHPGLKVGVEYPIWEKEKIKVRRIGFMENKFGSKARTKQLFVTGNVGFYNHANNHSAFFINSELGYRHIKQKKGRYLGANIGLGYLQRIYNIDTYELNEAGELEEIGGGKGQLMTSLSLVYGQDLSFKNDSPLSWHVKPTLLFLSPYGYTTVPNLALEVGVTYKLGK